MLKKRDLLVVLIGSLVVILAGILYLEKSYASFPFQIKVTSSKGFYLSREPILINYEVKNLSDSAICLVFDEITEYFNIKDQLGRGYSNIGTADYASCTDTLKPDQIFKGYVDLKSRYRVLQSGDYTCYVDFYGSKSNVLTIKVKDPTGDEKKALDLYLEAQKLDWTRDKDARKWEQAFYKYLELVEKYPNSVYAPLALDDALYKAHVIKDKNIVISVCKNLIENYPESYYVDDAFYNLIGNYKVLGDKAGAIAYVKGLTEKYPNTKISEKAKYWLEKTEKEKF
jgi:hypothetical protein